MIVTTPHAQVEVLGTLQGLFLSPVLEISQLLACEVAVLATMLNL
jgi:hypothetical protein